MTTLVELLRAGRALMAGHWAESAIFTLVYLVLAVALGLYSPWCFICLPTTMGYHAAFLDMARGRRLRYSHFFSHYARHGWWLAFSTFIIELQNAVLLLVPAMRVRYSYMFTPYVEANGDDVYEMTEYFYPEEGTQFFNWLTRKINTEAGTHAAKMHIASKRLMAGKRKLAFKLDMFFLVMFVPGVLTAGLGLLLLMPFYQCCRVALYEEQLAELVCRVEVKRDLDRRVYDLDEKQNKR